MSRNAIWSDAVLRDYRNAMVGLVRSGFAEAYGGDAGARLAATFGGDWAVMKSKAAETRMTGDVLTPLVDDFDVLGVSDLHKLLDAHFVVLVPWTKGQQPALAAEVKRRALEYANTVTNTRNAVAHPGELELSYEDAFRSIDSARRLLDLCKLPEASALQATLAQLRIEGLAELEERGHDAIEDRLPPRDAIVPNFVGRRRELQRLAEWIVDPKLPRHVLVGEGGKGKTAIAYEFGLRAKRTAPAPVTAILWITAKRRRYAEGQIVPAEPDFWDLESCVTAILKQYGALNEVELPIEERKRAALDYLRVLPAIVVADDIDSLEGGGEAAIEFLTIEVAQTPSRVLMTSRRTVLGAGHSTTQVVELQGAEANEFIDSRIELFGLDPAAFGPARRADIIRVTEGSPLYMEDLLRLSARGDVDDVIKGWAERRGDAAREYALRREFELLPPDAKETLLAASLYNGPVTAAELRQITGFTAERLENAIADLQRFYLMPKPRLIESVDRFEMSPNIRTLVRRALSATDIYRRVENAAKAVSGELLVRAEQRLKITGYARQAIALARQGNHADAEKTLKAGLDEFPNMPALLGQLGWVYKVWQPTPRVQDARECFRRAADLKAAEPEMFRHWCDLETKANEWNEAARVIERAMAAFPEDTEFVQFAGYVYTRLAQDLLRTSFDRETAKSHLRRSIRYFWDAIKRSKSEDTLSRAYRGICIAAQFLDDPGAALAALRGWQGRLPNDPQLEFERQRACETWPGLERSFDPSPTAVSAPA